MSDGCESGVHEVVGDGCPCGAVRFEGVPIREIVAAARAGYAGGTAIHEPTGDGIGLTGLPAVPVDLMPLLRRMDARLERMEGVVGEIRTAVMGEEG